MHTTPTPQPLDVPPGLAGVAVSATEIGDVRGEEGFYHYRQYSAVELASQRSLEDVWFLLVEGRLPDAAEGRAFADRVAHARQIPESVLAALPGLLRAAPSASPIALLPSALGLVGSAAGLRPLLDCDADERREATLTIAAGVPVLLAALHRLGTGQDPIAPRSDLGHAADYLRMATGVEPAAEDARALEHYLIATVEHGFNASTFTSRVVASTGADLAGCVVAALGALSGPLHGGAPGRALDAMEAIGEPDRATDWTRAELAAGRRIMGFGHPVYRTDDPRSVLLRDLAIRLADSSAQRGEPAARDFVTRAIEIERQVLEVLAEHKPDRPLKTNVEYYAGVVMRLVGLPDTMFTPTFASSRVIGWCAHVLEQAALSKIIRPSARYVGPPPPQPIPSAGAADRVP